jgi:hypothetical protein
VAWFKGDDEAHSRPAENRAWRASHASIGLHYLASSWVAYHLTDGVVDAFFVEEKLPDPAERQEAVDALVREGLWRPRKAGGWEIVDWLKNNPSGKQVKDRRAKRAAAGKAGADARWQHGS